MFWAVSYALATMVYVTPQLFGTDQLQEYGAVAAVQSRLPLTRKSTFATLILSAAFADREIMLLRLTWALFNGFVIAILGAVVSDRT